MRGLTCNASAAAVVAFGLLPGPSLGASLVGVPAAAVPPVLIGIVPNSGPAGIGIPLRATIHGTGFMLAGNVVEFGPATIADVPSTDKTSLSFSVPKLLPTRTEAQPPVLPAGQYSVRVRTQAGTSNALIFTLTPGG